MSTATRPAFQPIYTPSQIREAEAPLIAEKGDALMREAAYAVANKAKELMAQTYGSRVLVLTGSGNNGGDALYAAAELEKRGASIYVWPTGLEVNAEAMASIKHPTVVSELPERVDLVLDGIVGIGAHGPLAVPAARAVAATAGLPIVAVDIPSGLDPISGQAQGEAVQATATVTFGGLRPAHIRGFAHCGEVSVAKIGIDAHLGRPWGLGVQRADKWPYPGESDNKYTTGVVGIVAGSEEFPGAAVLTTAGAVRATSAMVRYAGPCKSEVLAAHPEVVATLGVESAGKVQAWVYGPGVGVDKHALLAMLERPEPLVIDADGLTALAASRSAITALLEREAFTVLTPHRGEFERITTAKNARMLAKEWGVCVLLKGRVTEVAFGDELYLIEAGSSWAATPGSGDVLSGVVGAAIAYEPSARMVANAARMHADAATLCGGPVPASLIAEALTRAVRPKNSGVGK